MGDKHTADSGLTLDSINIFLHGDSSNLDGLFPTIRDTIRDTMPMSSHRDHICLNCASPTIGHQSYQTPFRNETIPDKKQRKYIAGACTCLLRLPLQVIRTGVIQVKQYVLDLFNQHGTNIVNVSQFLY